MPIAITFPASLPSPSISTVAPNERRVLSDVTGGPQQFRGVQRDYLATQRVEWNLLTPTQAAVLDAWWKETLIYGGAWFASTWPAPQGLVSLTRRFLGVIQWQHIAGGFWRASAQVQLRGRGLPPQFVLRPLVWNPAVSTVPPWVIAGASASLSASFAEARRTIFADQYAGIGKRYFEITVTDASSSDSGHLIGKMGVTRAGLVAHWQSYISGTGNAIEVADGDAAGTSDGYFPTWSSGSPVMQFAVDLDAGTMWIGKDGSWGSGSPAPDPANGIKPGFTGIVGPVTPFVRYYALIPNTSVALRSTAATFTYVAPTGFIPFGS